jgi:hypothetical protein
MGVPARARLLASIAEIRTATMCAASQDATTAERVERLADALRAWTWIPSPGREFYGQEILGALFLVAESIEDDESQPEWTREVLELSLWDVATELQLIALDTDRAPFVRARRARLLRTLESNAQTDVERLLLRWAVILEPKSGRVTRLPGEYEPLLQPLLSTLARVGLPRRARAIGQKFNVPVDTLARWQMTLRPESEEVDRAVSLLPRLVRPPRLIPYAVLKYGRLLHSVIAAPIGKLPIVVGATGRLSIEGRPFGYGAS